MAKSGNTRGIERSTQWVRALVLLSAGAFAAGCAGEQDVEDADVVAESGDAISQDDICRGNNVTSERCAITKFFLYEAAPEERKMIMQRAYSWIDAKVKYNANASYANEYGRYTRDCSGFVSMAWGLQRTFPTAAMAPFKGDFTWEIPADDLIAGDAISRRRRINGKGHIMLFAGWADDAHQQFFVIEQRGTGIPTVLSIRDRSMLNEYAAIRLFGY